MKTDVDKVKDLYAIICNRELGDDWESVQKRVNIVQELERLTTSHFKDTADFHRKVGRFIIMRDNPSSQLRVARKAKGWTLDTLGVYLGVSKQFCSQMEKGRKPLIDKALEFIGKPVIQGVA